MDNIFFFLAAMTATMIGVTFHAWRISIERRDVALFAVFAGLFAAGTAVAAMI